MDLEPSFGRWLRARRRALDLTQAELARHVGCSVVSIQKIEADERRPSRQIAERLADCLKVEANDRAAVITLARAEPYFDPTPADVPEPRLHALQSLPGNLPAPLTHLIGRKQDVAAVRNTLLHGETRLLTLVGPPGIGKTRLGIAVAHDVQLAFADGAYFIGLATISDPLLVLATIAQTLRLKQATGQQPIDRLRIALQTKRLLLVLDNFEQVLDAAPLLIELLEACPGLKALVTSRAALHVRGERLYSVPPLLLPDLISMPATVALARNPAVSLFVERAQAMLLEFRLTKQNASAVAAICAQLDGLPLAIELAATRIRLMAPETLLARLEQRLALLTDGARDLPPRHRTLRTAIAWSYDLLDAGEQTLFRRLSVFVGGWTLEAAKAVCLVDSDLPSALMDSLAALVEKSLLQRSAGPDGEPRFTMLETIREYALEQLEESCEAKLIRLRHAEYFLTLAEAAEPHLRTTERIVWVERLEVEHGNLRAALAWSHEHGSVELAARMGSALCRYWDGAGRLSEGRAWLTASLAQCNQLADAVCAKVLWAAGEGTENLVEQQALFEESLRLFRTLGDTTGIAEVLGDLGGIAQVHGNYAQARAYYGEKLALCREHGDQIGEIQSLIRLGRLVIDEGEELRAAALFQEALSLSRAIDDPHHVARAMVGLGIVAQRRGAPDQATTHYREALALLRGLEQSGLIVSPLLYLAELAFQKGDLAEATARYTECLRLVVERYERFWIAECLVGFAQLAAARGQLERVVRLSGAATVFFDSLAVPPAFAGRAAFERLITAWRAELDEATFAAAWAAGQALTLDQAVAEALAVADTASGQAHEIGI